MIHTRPMGEWLAEKATKISLCVGSFFGELNRERRVHRIGSYQSKPPTKHRNPSYGWSETKYNLKTLESRRDKIEWKSTLADLISSWRSWNLLLRRLKVLMFCWSSHVTSISDPLLLPCHINTKLAYGNSTEDGKYTLLRISLLAAAFSFLVGPWNKIENSKRRERFGYLLMDRTLCDCELLPNHFC